MTVPEVNRRTAVATFCDGEWLLYGELPDDAAANVVLADGSQPPVLSLGQLWACEWESTAQPATVHVAGNWFDIPFTEPHYRRR